MDYFHEENVVKTNAGVNTALYFLFYAGMIFFGVLALMYLKIVLSGMFDVIIIIMTIVFAGMSYGSFILRNNQRVEYDYTFTNGILDIAKIINRSKRKKMLSADIREFQVVAPIHNNNFQSVLKDKGIKQRYNLFLNRGRNLYYCIILHEGKKSLLVFEPSQEMLKLFKIYIPHNVII